MTPELISAFFAGLVAGFSGCYVVTRLVVRGAVLELRNELYKDSQSIEHRLTEIETHCEEMRCRLPAEGYNNK